MYSSQKDSIFADERNSIDRWLADPAADRVIKRRREIQYCYGDGTRNNTTPTRAAITSMTPASGNRLRRYIDNYYADFTGMITLTYGAEWPTDGREVKRHLAAFFERMRKGGLFEEISLVWWLEFQERGAPHIHILVTGWVPKDWIARTWAQITKGNESACSRVEALRNPDAAGAYAAKYAAKADQKTVPPGYERVGRFWGRRGLRPADGGSCAPKVSAVTYARAAALVRGCAGAQMQAREWNREAGNGPRVEIPPIYVEGRCLWSVRCYEHDGGYSIYGSEQEIDELWRYLQAHIAVTAQTARPPADTRPRT